MKIQEVKIEIPKGFEVDKEKSTFERIIFKELSSPMDKVYEYHKTTEEEFNKLYQNIPSYVKAYQKECMIVAYYNKGWIPNFKDKSERKYYLWFYLDEFRLYDALHYGDCSTSSARLLFKSEKDALEASELFFQEFKESRMFNQ